MPRLARARSSRRELRSGHVTPRLARRRAASASRRWLAAASRSARDPCACDSRPPRPGRRPRRLSPAPPPGGCPPSRAGQQQPQLRFGLARSARARAIASSRVARVETRDQVALLDAIAFGIAAQDAAAGFRRELHSSASTWPETRTRSCGVLRGRPSPWRARAGGAGSARASGDGISIGRWP